MSIVEVQTLRKVYPVKRKQPGLSGSLKALWRPEYTPVIAVDGVSFTVEPGETVGFIGPNGAGKSTTIKMLAGILYPSSGSARVLGLIPWEQRQRLAYRVASVFGQRSQLWYHLPPADSFALLRRIYELDEEPFRQRLEVLVERFALAPYLRVPVRRLSLGERMRCEVVAALLHRPALVFLDEPTIGLDVVARGQIRSLIRALNHDEGVTFFLTSHDAGDIEQVCRRVIVINHGVLVFDNAVSEMKRTFLRRKVIDLKLAEEGTPPSLAGITVIDRAPYRLRLALDSDVLPIESAIARIVAECPVADLTVEEPPLDEVIAEIYARTGRTVEARG